MVNALYYDEPDCYACPAYNDGNVEFCQECIEERHMSVDVLQVGVGCFGNKAVIKLPDGTLKTVFQSKLTLLA